MAQGSPRHHSLKLSFLNLGHPRQHLDSALPPRESQVAQAGLKRPAVTVACSKQSDLSWDMCIQVQPEHKGCMAMFGYNVLCAGNSSRKTGVCGGDLTEPVTGKVTPDESLS
ncbi:hypothetical protein FALBO_356 [Fusarium albosuccineum]|uniref:Uncharacterized protein n=1 Tax=Fusarium albosuccineum TaxID=1237068 RepID=A0A8H4LRG7_9HYPO|nr:hypothetical protein FALBO_356 [Fusarium albosuccineum]